MRQLISKIITIPIFLSLVLILCAGFPSRAQLNMTFLGKLSYTSCGSVCINDVWGYVDTSGNEYALVGVGSGGVSVVDVTNPTIPTEVFFAPGAGSIWRDLKTWNNHAYITNESSGGLMIIDLSSLPSNPVLTVTNYTGGGLNSAHNLFIDENGFAYIFGSNLGGPGTVILDLNIDPKAPVQMGIFSTYYIHDGMVRGDTLWAAHSSNGIFSAIDVSDKTNPVIFNAGTATHSTGPPTLTHNCWISDDGKTLFTTDEVNNAFVKSYDVSDLSNITELDKIQSNPGQEVMPHNTHVKGDFLVTSYYADGVTIVDASRPANMIEVGFYDTSPLSGGGSNGCWGVYPFLPSGNILATDASEGLFVLGVNYVYACYLEGTVTDLITTNPINNATIEILTTSLTASSDINGDYAMGILAAGTYNIAFSAPGYISDTLTAILSNGVLTVINAQLVGLIPFALSGQVIESGTGNPVPNAGVKLENNDFQFSITTDAGGNFTIPNFFKGNYEVIAGKWNYITKCFNQYIDSTTSTIIIQLDSGIYDDFTFNFGWTVVGNAVAGIWERGEPVGTDWISTGDANPDVDVITDCSNQAYVTGNAGGGVGSDDVDNGNTVLTSPVFDLSSFAEPNISYYRWFFNDGGAGNPNDTLKVSLTNGTTTVLIDTVTEASVNNSTWVLREFKISDFLTPTATMQVIFETSDMSGSGHLVEAAVDKFQVSDCGMPPVANISSSVNSICISDTIQFTSNSNCITSYQWSFQGGNPSSATVQNPTVVYDTVGVFDVTLIVSGSSGSDTSTSASFITVSICTAIDESPTFESNFIKAYPNPFSAAFQIEYKLMENAPGASIVIVDLMGRIVAKTPLKGEEGIITFNNDLSRGVYFAKIINGKKFSNTVKLIKF